MKMLTDTSPEGMRRAIELSHRQSWLSLRGSPRVEVVESAELIRFASGLPLPPFNSVMRARLNENTADRAIEEAIEYFGAKKLPWSWTVEESATPTDLPERLTARGLIEDAAEPGMAIDLKSMPKTWSGPEGLSIEKVTGRDLGGEYSRVLAAGFGMPEEIARGFGQIMGDVTEGDDSKLVGHLGRVDGVAVATSMLIASGTAGIYNVSTLANYRGRGVGAALSVASLLQAREMGYRIGALQASQMGYGVYERLGFREYCRIRQFVWRPKELDVGGKDQRGCRSIGHSGGESPA